MTECGEEDGSIQKDSQGGPRLVLWPPEDRAHALRHAWAILEVQLMADFLPKEPHILRRLTSLIRSFFGSMTGRGC